MIALAMMTMPAFAETYFATSAPSSNVESIIAITVEEVANSLGDIRLNSVTDTTIMDVTLQNNDMDGYSITFSSGNQSYPTAQGHLVHTLTAGSTTPNAGQMPSAKYTLDYVSAGSGLYGTDTPDPADFSIGSDHTINYTTNVLGATEDAHFDVTISQTSDLDLFHGVLKDTITVTAADI